MPDPPLNIFISYAQSDSAFVERLKADIRQQDLGNWIDRHALPVWRRWHRALQAALDGCQVLLVVLSLEAVVSEEVQSEYSYAMEEGKVSTTWQHSIRFRGSTNRPNPSTSAPWPSESKRSALSIPTRSKCECSTMSCLARCKSRGQLLLIDIDEAAGNSLLLLSTVVSLT